MRRVPKRGDDRIALVMVNHDFDKSIVKRTAHRPWPMPEAPWLMTQTWHELLFAHWRVDASELRRMIRLPFELDLFNGDAWPLGFQVQTGEAVLDRLDHAADVVLDAFELPLRR
jgi:hypothetical protein